MTRDLLLSSKPISEFSSDEYAEYVRSLYVPPAPKKVPKVRTPKVKPVPKLTFSLTKKGALSVRGRRKWVTEAEFRAACFALRLRLRSVWITLKEKGFRVVRDETAGKATEEI